MQWPESDDRINNIARNGNTGAHYNTFTDVGCALDEAEFLAENTGDSYALVSMSDRTIIKVLELSKVKNKSMILKVVK